MKILALGLLAIALSGCASLQSFFGSPTGQVVVIASVDIAVQTAESKGVSAVEINRVAKLALAADTGAAGTLSAISALVNAQIATLHLPAGDMAAVQILEAALQAAIQAKIGDNKDLAAAQAAVATVLQQVILVTGGSAITVVGTGVTAFTPPTPRPSNPCPWKGGCSTQNPKPPRLA